MAQWDMCETFTSPTFEGLGLKKKEKKKKKYRPGKNRIYFFQFQFFFPVNPITLLMSSQKKVALKVLYKTQVLYNIL